MQMFTARDRLKLLAGGAAFSLSACGGSTSSPTVTPPPPPVVVTPPTPAPTVFVPTVGQFRDQFAGKFSVGAAIQNTQIGTGNPDTQILKDQFNSITAEYQMKPEIIAPTEGNYDWTIPDALVDFAEQNGMVTRGHALVWHQATPDYFFVGTPAEVKARLQTFITDVVTRYKGRIYAWDVVNEAVTDSGSSGIPYRQSNWWTASGGNADYIDWAFEAARAADPDCLLFINDYNTEQAGKRGRLVQVLKDLTDRGIPLDGVGHQMHLTVDTPVANVTAAIDAVDNEFMGLDQHITELDVSIYSDPGSCFSNQTGCAADYGNSIPDSVFKSQAESYRDLFEVFAAKPSVTSVTVWGISDAQSWLDSFPIDRTNAALLWDRDRDAKSALQAVLDPNFTP